MVTRAELAVLMHNLGELQPSDEAIKKTSTTTVGKLRVDEGIATFTNTKNVTITFYTPFARPPKVSLELNTNSNNPPYKTAVTTTSFTIKMQTNWTGQLEWTVTERP